jgi:hypothetical protein
MQEDARVCAMQENPRGEHSMLEELMVCLVEVVALVVKQEEVALGFQP